MLVLATSSVLSNSIAVNMTLHLLAVSVNGAGEVIDANIWVSMPGSGIFTVYPSALVGQDTALSARLALAYAAMLNHISPEAVDAGVDFETSGSVSGASAGLAFLTGYYVLLHGDYIDAGRYSFTGLVAPSGIVAAVGGLSEKIAAAKNTGIDVIVVPLEAGVANTSVAGVRVVAVCSFADVLREMYNVSIVGGLAPRGDRLFCDAARELIQLADEIIEKYGGLLANNTASFVMHRAAAAELLVKRGRCYAAASIVYSALVAAIETANGEVLDNITSLILSKVDRDVFAAKLYEMKTRVMRSKHIPLWRLEALLATLYRFYASVKLLEEKDAKLRALGALRLLTARQWLDVAMNVTGPLVRADVVRNGLSLLISYAELSYKYLESLIHGRQVNIRNAEHLRLRKLVSDMQMYYMKGDLVTAAALALEAINTIDRSIVVFDINMGAQPARLADCGAKQAELNQLMSGYRSLIAMLLAEYGASVNDTVGRALVLTSASSFSLLPLALSAASFTPVTPNVRAQSVGADAALLSIGVGIAMIVGGLLSAVILSKKVE